MTEIDWKRLGVFVGTLVVLIATAVVVATRTDVSGWTIGPLYMFTPMIAGLMACLAGGVSLSSVGLRRGRIRWLVGACGLFLGLVVVTIPLSVLIPGILLQSQLDVFGYNVLNRWPVDLPSGVPGVVAALGLVVVSGVTLQAVLGFGEEFGWRGYLLWELAPLGFWTASFVIGVVWALWHAPVAFVWGREAGATYAMLTWLLALPVMSPLYTYVVIRAKSVLAAALSHGIFNAAVVFVGHITATESVFLSAVVLGPVSLVGVVVFGLATITLAVVGPPTLTREFAYSPRSSQNRTTPTTDTDA